MARTVYYVVLHEGQWKISLSGKHHGPYTTQKEAIRLAVDAANIEGKKTPMAPRSWCRARIISFARSGRTATIPIRRRAR